MLRRALPPLLLAVLALCACGATTAELAADGTEATKAPKPLTSAQRHAAKDKADDAAVWIGTVKSYDGSIDDLVVLDYGGTYTSRVDLAHVVPQGRCDYSSDSDFGALYTAAIQAFAPIGSTIAVVRSQRKDGTPDLEPKGYLYPVNADRSANLAGPSLNEQLVVAGTAVPDPEVSLHPESYDRTGAEVVAAQQQLLSPLDFGYWHTFVDAYVVADRKQIGPVGQCAVYEIAKAKQEATDKAERDRDFDRWHRGPDGKLGTNDDYSYTSNDDGGSSGGSGGGSGGANVPGGLCPTRWC